MRRLSLLIATVSLTCLAPPALAHRMWLLPSTTTLADTGQWVTVDAAISNDLFYPDHVAFPLAQVKVWTPEGTPAEVQNGATGRYRTTFDVKIDRTGTWKIGSEMNTVMGSFTLNGETWRVGRRRGPGGPRGPGGGAPGQSGAPAPVRSVATVEEIPANATDVKLTESISRNFTFVTAGAPTTAAFAPTGKGLEFQPISHPSSLVADEPGQFRFLIDGKPAAGIKVTVVPGSKKFRAAEQAQELTTGADGVVRVNWPIAGTYWISATATDAHPSIPRATERRMSYTTTVEVPAP